MLRVVQAVPRHTGQQAADGDAVAYHRDHLPVILPGDARKGGVGPVPDLGVGLRPIQLPVLLIGDEAQHFFGLLIGHVSEKLCLPGAYVDLPQQRLGLYGEIMPAADGRGGHPGAVQVAGIQRVNMYVFKAFCQQINLPQTQLGHAAVPVALHHPVEISLRLSVPNEINFRHNCASKS